MKPSNSRLVVTIALICSILLGASHFSSAREIFAANHQSGGRLIIKRSPTLGHNVTMTLKIDGQVAGTSVRGRVFDRYITPGHHVLLALPNRHSDAWRGNLDIRAGQTYTYIVTHDVNRIVLNPVR